MEKLALPDVSVVLAVRNEAGTIQDTLRSIDRQRDVHMEVIIVDDGSDDDTPRLLDNHASKRPHYRVCHQSWQGLTAALIQGCSMARAPLVARHDGGDRSTPDRLARQVAAIESDPSVVMVSSATEFYDPEGNLLYTMSEPDGERSVHPSHHGCTLFRRDVYERVGGYRRACYVAQDLDLWLRMTGYGRHMRLTELGYLATIRPGSVSVDSRERQVQVTELLKQAAVARRAGKSEAEIMDKVYRISRETKARAGHEVADYHYFAGSCLRMRNPVAARRHFRAALREQPFHFRAAIRFLQALLRRPSDLN